MKKIKDWLKKPRIRFALILLGIFALCLLFIDIFYFDEEYLKNIVVEAHGLLFDLFVFGIVIAIYDLSRHREENIERYQEEIEDFRRWDEKEAMYRIVGNVKRLNREGVSRMRLSYCYLEKADLKGVDLKGAYLIDTNLKGARLIKADLSGTKLIGTKFVEADLTDANLTQAELTSADLTKARLIKADLSQTLLIGTNLNGANLTDANLTYADLTDTDLTDTNLFRACFSRARFSRTIGLSFDLLKSTATLFEAEGIPENLLSRLKKEKPELFEKPKCM